MATAALAMPLQAFAQPLPTPAAPVAPESPPSPPDAPSTTGVLIGPHAIRVTMADAVERADSQNPTVRAAMAAVLGADGNVALARSAYFPVIHYQNDGTIRYSNSPTLFATTPPCGTPPCSTTPVFRTERISSSSAVVDAQINASMTLWDFGRTSNSVAAAHHAVTSIRESLASTIRTSVLAAAVAYLTVLSDRELIASSLVTLHQDEQHLAISTGLVAAGSHPEIEQVRAQVDLESARLGLITAQAQEQTDRAALAAAIGMDPAVEIDVVPIPEDALHVDDDPRQAADLAVASRPEFHSARAHLASMESALASARANRLPILSTTVGATASELGVLAGNVASGPTVSASGAVTFMVPLFDYSVGANIQIADANVENARESLDAESLAVRTDAVQSALAVRGANATLDQSVRLEYESEQNLHLAEGQYRNGAAALLVLVDAQAADETARVQVVRARFALQLARVRLLASITSLEVLSHLQ